MRNGGVLIVLLALAMVGITALPGVAVGASQRRERVQPAGEEPTFQPPALPRRLAGPDREATSAAIAIWAHPIGSQRVYLAHRDRGFPVALAAGAMADGPTMLVPGEGDPPDAVREALDALDPQQLVALGAAEGGVSDTVLAELAQGRDTTRVEGGDDSATALALALAGFGEAAEVVYLAQSIVMTDGMVGGVLQGGPILLVPADGPVPQAVVDTVARLEPQRVVALGGSRAISDQVLADVAAELPTSRLAGRSRFETAAAVAQHAFPGGADLVYLARHDVVADAIVGGSLGDGPILLVEGCNPDLHPATSAELGRLRPEGVIALGGEAAVCDAVLDAADIAARG
ncbi:MAG TPA: cell wall-binding repeat-containing protein [Euzebya sp.]|nr:cell wall-binding repeat-containing protein [Euzebya sp.]